MELTPPVARYEQVARHLARQILDGVYAADEVLPGAPTLAVKLGVSQSVGQKALEVLEGRGLVRSDAGRGTVVLARRRYLAQASVPWGGGDRDRDADFEAARTWLLAGADSDPVMTEATVTRTGDVMRLSVAVSVADSGFASARAMDLVRSARLGGWDLSAASVEAHPAGGA